ncbi:putative farnesyltransferase [Podospora australis]|uniref:Protein farnesyltransferase/geranylgeranyltransferase type-1 subunit alpha n=1 Tax=Podospora australis TaxID=1536484 RepID=A0AAN6X119_9PEZI|nr:putative farnesyltransferase [Podospora australis]
MPPKGKKAKNGKSADSSSTPGEASTAASLEPFPPAEPGPSTSTAENKPKGWTVFVQSQIFFDITQPPTPTWIDRSVLEGKGGAEAAALWLAPRLAVTHRLFYPNELGKVLGPKSQEEIWKAVNNSPTFPLRVIKRRQKAQSFGIDSRGREVGTYTLPEFEAREERRIKLSCLLLLSNRFSELRDRERRGFDKSVVVTEQEYLEEKARRKEMAQLQKKLYGTQGMAKEGKLALDPEWDDVTPIKLEEPEKALAAIAYTADYAEAMSYLRAVMHAKEYSPRCLKLTEYIIEMNPAHYTVWLYRAANIFALKLSIPDEFVWLNAVALENLKNYQIWHHRHLLVENYWPVIASDPRAIAKFAEDERDFLTKILAEDTKNYHVWSYRSYLVGKLNLYSDPEELQSIEDMIDADVRNNSAWSHRFFLVFLDPKNSSPGVPATQPDSKVPGHLVDREIAYAKEKIELAPQNQSGWHYLRGVLAKGARPLTSVEEFAASFVVGLGEGENEDVRSTHALELLAESYIGKEEPEKADLCFSRLAEKWDRIREGYWEWLRQQS